MGAKDSKRSCLPYEDAVKRMSDEEFKRICEAFKRLSGGNSLLSKQIFIQYVLGDCVPITIAECLYQACGGTVRGITLKDLICGLVLLTKGKQDEKIRFLWTLYSNDNGQYIQRNEFNQSLEMEGVLDKKQNINRIMLSLFPIGQDRINFEQFNLWIQYNYDATILSKWLLTPIQSTTTISTTNVSLSCTEIETPTFYQTLAGVTHLDEQDICELEKCFWTLQSQSLTGHLDINFIRTMICPPIPITLYDGLFNALDVNHDGHIDFKELCCGISAACRGPLAERMKFCFKLFDLDRDLYLNHNELKHMVQTLMFITNDQQQQQHKQQEDVIMESLKKRLDLNNGGLSQEEFLVWSIEENYLIEPLLELLFQVCHISFVLKPNCRHHEYDIVHGWLEREERHGYHIGQFWYLISIKWWQQWLNYTTLPYNQNYDQCNCYNNNTTNNSSSNNSLKIFDKNNHNIIEDGIVCDESLISNSTDYTTNSSNEFNSNSMESMGDLLSNKGDSCSIASSSGVSSSSGTTNLKQRHYNQQQQQQIHGQQQQLIPPGPIDNKNLIEESSYLNINSKIQTLTGEGGRLKRNTPLVQNRDFILIPDTLWKALAHWYGGPLPLPRQVILPPGSHDVELELYPINLNIYKHQSITVQQQQQQTTWSSVVGGYGAAALNTAGITTTTTQQISTNQTIPKRYLAYTAAFSRLANIRQVTEFLCQRLQLRYEDIRLWHIKDNNNHQQTILLEDENLTLQDLNIIDNDKILLEIRNKDLTWPEELNALVVDNNNSTNNNSLSNMTTTLERRPTICLPPGATGLHNLGNTCFMNAALQAVSNTRPLTLYFQRDGQLIELNSINPLGTKGMVAKRYAELCRELWAGSTRSVAPLKLRYCVTKHAPHLGGGGQHDSQELLAWLLDALHEDLNRVAKKQYIELKDSAGRPDEIVADEAWSLHLSRDHSIITDLFYGQLKSKVTCQTCGHESVRFDPFNLLSLPLPMESYTLCEVLVVRLSGDIPVKYGLRLNSDAKYLELKQQLSKLCNIETKYLLLAEIEYSQIRTIINDDLRINPATATELYAYELPDFYQNDYNLQLEQQHEQQFQQQQQQQQQQECDLDIAVLDSPLARSPEVRGGSALCMPNILCFKTKERNYSGCINDNNSSSNDNNNIIKSSILRKQPIRKYNDDFDDDEDYSDDNNINKRLNDNNIDGGAVIINNNNNNNDNINNFPQYLIAVHRKSVRQEIYFLSQQKQKPSLFGMPLLLGCCKTSTCQSLYEEVLNQITRLLSPLPQSDQTNHATDCDDSLGYEFPFTLKMVLQGGQICAICHWTQFCRGCTLPCTDELLIDKFKGKQNIINIAIDWDPTALHLRYQSNREKLWIDDESVGYYRKLHTEPIDLDYCLRAFTSEERLEAKYHCSNCQNKQPATKKLQIWRLPPILIIHLKRFDYVNNKWVKTQKVVNFPFKDFDPTEYLASVPQETILRHHQLKQQKQDEEKKKVQNLEQQHELNDIIDECCEQQQQQPPPPQLVNDEKEQLLENNPKQLQKSNNQRQQRRNRLESTSLLKTPIIDEHLKDYHQHKLLPGQDPFDLKYQLYAVVSHSGMLNGGHYISYACNPNGNWYCYNDSSCREVLTQELATQEKSPLLQHKSNDDLSTGTNDCLTTTTTEQQPKCVYSDVKIPKIDTSTAYILFYERSGLDYKPYLPDIVANNNSNNDVNNINGQIVPDLDLDENESELRKQLCVLQ